MAMRAGADAAARRRWTLVLVNLASVVEKADEVLLPAVYREVGAALGASPTALGSLTLCRALVQAACYPLAAYASARHDRARVIAVGAFLWAAATFLVAVSGTFLQPDFRGDCAAEGEDDSVRAGQVLRSRVRVVCASNCWCSCGEGVWIQAGLIRYERGHGQGECCRIGQGGLHGDRRAHGHLLPDIHLPLLHVPARQGSCSEGASDRIR